MTFVGATTAHAQDTVNPLISTTGPNVLGSGHIQWNTALKWDHFKTVFKEDIYGANTDLRFGIGSRAELTLGVKAYHDDYNSYPGNSYVYNSYQDNIIGTVIDDRYLFDNNTGIAPSVGARLLLYEGKAWLPKVTFYTSVALATITGRQWTADETLVQPTIGLSFRNNLGKGWMLDYTLDFSWNRHFPRQDYYPASLSVFARWLATDRLLLSAGFSTPGWAEIFKGVFELRYLATPNLQLTLQGGLSGGSGMGFDRSTFETNLLAGVSWMLK
jgi:hypothetical protein